MDMQGLKGASRPVPETHWQKARQTIYEEIKEAKKCMFSLITVQIIHSNKLQQSVSHVQAF